MIELIKYNAIPNKFVGESYKDFLPLTERVIKKPDNLNRIIQTENRYQIIGDNNYEQRKIQTVVYEQYYVSVFIKERHGLNNLLQSNSVQWVDFNGTSRNIEITEISYERVSNGLNYRATINFYVKDNPEVNNYLESVDLLALKGSSNLHKLTITFPKNFDGYISGSTLSFYTLLNPVYSVIKGDARKEKQADGTEINSNLIQFESYEMIFFFNDATRKLFDKYVPVCFKYDGSYNASGVTATLRSPISATITSVEPCSFELTDSKELTGLWERRLVIKYNILNMAYFS